MGKSNTAARKQTSLRAQSSFFWLPQEGGLGEASDCCQYPTTGVWQDGYIEFILFFEHHQFSEVKLDLITKTDMCYTHTHMDIYIEFK